VTRPVLGIDTSGNVGSVALWSPTLELEEVFEEGLIHGVALAPAAERVLAEAGLAVGDLAGVAAGLGPGSYTGVRVGVSFAKALAHAAGLPAVGVPSLDAMAENAPPGRDVVCARDARRGTLYLRAFHTKPGGAEARGPLRLVPLDEVGSVLPEEALVLGDAVDRFPELLSGGMRTFGEKSLWRSAALTVARLGASVLVERGVDDVHDLAPIYLRASEAEERLGR
jgi:tRNA threonylcarbamoyladenosine biosynthesis protein TsaB